MMFSDITKQAQEVIFSQPFHPQFYLNKVAVERSFSQKHLGYIDIKSWILINSLMKQISKARKEHQSIKIFLIYRQEMPF